MNQLQQITDKYFSSGEVNEELKNTISKVFSLINSGEVKICQKEGSQWKVNQWVKKVILLSFKINNNQISEFGNNKYFDKVPLKFQSWTERDFQKAGFRAVAGSVVRDGTFIGKNTVLMPSFINIGAYIDEGTMIDSWATVGSCAQIGKNCHISGGAGIGGVLEPLQANPVIIEDNCFIGARSEIVEGVIVGKGSVISMGVFVGQSTKIVDRETGNITYGKIPEYSVVVPGSIQTKGNISLSCAVIIKRVDEKTRSKTGINELLRD
jgi:2,3,4,5-tetrahydropyridine-2-carboxylate N-succinyltransferase